MPEPDLFGLDEVPPYQRHSATSRAAAERVTSKRYTIRAGVLELLWEEALTDADIALRLGLPDNSTRSARIANTRAGLVEACGIGTTPSGCPATLWRAVRGGAPPGARRSPAGGSGAPRETVTTGQRRQAQPTGDTAEKVGALWTAVRDCRPTWMSQSQHQGVVKAAIEAYPGDIVSGLRQALRDLQAMGGGR